MREVGAGVEAISEAVRQVIEVDIDGRHRYMLIIQTRHHVSVGCLCVCALQSWTIYDASVCECLEEFTTDI